MRNFLNKVMICLMLSASAIAFFPKMAECQGGTLNYTVNNNPLTVVSSSAHGGVNGFAPSVANSSTFINCVGGLTSGGSKNDTLVSSGMTFPSDTIWLKVSGGTSLNHLHFVTVANKVSGTADSMQVTVYGTVETGTAGSGVTMNWKSLSSQYVSNTATGNQVLDYIVQGNDYTNYMIVARNAHVLANTNTCWFLYEVLFR
jgi:hypothetical protein